MDIYLFIALGSKIEILFVFFYINNEMHYKTKMCVSSPIFSANKCFFFGKQTLICGSKISSVISQQMVHKMPPSIYIYTGRQNL